MIFLTVIEDACMYFPLVVGAYAVFSLMKVPDLSIESAYVCGAILGARTLMLTNNMPLPICFIASLTASILGGVIVGLTSSMLTKKAKFPHLLSSIVTTGIFHGCNQFLLGTSNVSLASKRNLMGLFNFVRRYPELPEFILFFILLSVITHYFLRTQLGTSLAVYGNNPGFFKHYGISTRFVFFSGILVSNGLAGLAGFFDSQASGFVDINMGGMKALFCITSIILGKTIFNGLSALWQRWHDLPAHTIRPYSVWVPILGSFVYYIIVQSLLKVHFNLKYFTMVQSIIVGGILIVRYHKSRTGTNHLGV